MLSQQRSTNSPQLAPGRRSSHGGCTTCPASRAQFPCPVLTVNLATLGQIQSGECHCLLRIPQILVTPTLPPHNPPPQDAQSRLLPCVHETILPLELHVPCPLPHTAAPRSFPLRCLSGSSPRLWLAANNTYKTAEAVPRQGTVRQKVLRK